MNHCHYVMKLVRFLIITSVLTQQFCEQSCRSVPLLISESFNIENVLFDKILPNGAGAENSRNYNMEDFTKVSKSFYQIYYYRDLTELLGKITFIRDVHKGKTALVFFTSSIHESLNLVQMVAKKHPNLLSRNSGIVLLVIFPVPENEGCFDFCDIYKSSSITMNISLASDVYFVSEDDKNRRIDLWEVYFIKYTPFCQKIETTIKASEEIDLLSLIHRKVLRRQDFKGVEIIGGAVESDKLKYATKFILFNSITKFDDGLEVDMYRLMRDRLNFSEKAIVTNHARDPAITGEIDISLTGSVATVERQSNGTFIQPTHTFFGIKVYIAQPSSNPFRDIYLSAFQYSVWLAMFSTWAIVIITLNVFVFIKRKMKDLDEKDDTISTDSILLAVASGTQQGWYTSPSSFSLKIVSICASMSGLVCFIAFSAAIVSTLSIKNAPIKSFDDILKANYKLFIEDSLYRGYIRLDLDAINRTQIKVIENIVPEMERGDSAMISWPDVFYTFMRKSEKYQDKDVCNKFIDFPVIKTRVLRAMFVKYNSPLLESFNYVITVMKERGLSFRPINKYTRDFKVTCIDLNVVNYQDLGLKDVFTSFAILFAGYVASICTLFIEMQLFVYKMKDTYLQ